MFSDNSGVAIGEDALSTYYSSSSNSSSSLTSHPLTTSATSSSSTSSSSSGRRQEAGFLNFFRRRSWFGLTVSDEEMKTKKDTDTVSKIMKHFRDNDIAGMEKFIGDEKDKMKDDSNVLTQKNEEDSEMWWDDNEFLLPKPAPKSEMCSKYTPHPKKGTVRLPPAVLKAVRFSENTPEDREKRPFTPMFTSTPKTEKFWHDAESDSDNEMPPLSECDSNTVIPPHQLHNNTSSILLSNASIMCSLNKCRQQTIDAVCLPSIKNSYKICYDDTDEEEVVEEEPSSEAPTPSRRTFVQRNQESDSSSKTVALQDQSIDLLDLSTNSSVVLGLDSIETYIHYLEDEIEAANRYAREKDMQRAIGAVQKARILQERFEQMNENINEMCKKLPIVPDQIISPHEVSAVFDNSNWEVLLGPDDASFENNQLY